MFASRYFCNRYFAPRYWPKVGAAVVDATRYIDLRARYAIAELRARYAVLDFRARFVSLINLQARY